MFQKPHQRSRRSVLIDSLGNLEGLFGSLVSRISDTDDVGVVELEEALRRLGKAAARLGLGHDLERALRSGERRSVFRGADCPDAAALALVRPSRRARRAS